LDLDTKYIFKGVKGGIDGDKASGGEVRLVLLRSTMSGAEGCSFSITKTERVRPGG